MTRPLVGAVLVLLASTSLGADQLCTRVSMKPFKSGGFSMEYPDGGGWRQTPAGGSAGDLLMLLTKQPDIRVFVRRTKLVQPISQSAGDEVLTIFAQYEGEAVKENSPEASNVRSTMVTHPSLGRVVRIDYTQPAMATTNPGVRERVQQFSVPAGEVLYRIIFSGSPKEFEKEVGRFNAMLDSVRIASPAGQDQHP